MLTLNGCTLRIVPHGIFVSAALDLWSHCFTSDICCALFTYAYKILVEDSENGDIWKILFQSSSIHPLIAASSHHSFG